MLRSNRWSEKPIADRKLVPPLRWIVLAIALVAGGEIGLLLPSLVSRVSPAIDRFEGNAGASNSVFWGLIIGVLVMALIIIFRQHELAATLVIASSIVADLYLGLYFVSLLIACLLLVTFFLARSPGAPWIKPPVFWLWISFVVLAIFPATHGIDFFDSMQYYLRVFLGAFIMFWLGTLFARNLASIRGLMRMLYIFGVLVALLTILQAVTGRLLFSTSRYEARLQSVASYQLGTTGISRPGAFLINPDPNACFLAIMLILGLGLLVENPSVMKKVLFFAGSLIIALALLLTFSTEGMLSAIGGSLVLLVLVGRMRYRIFFLLLLVGAVAIILIAAPTQIALLLQHAQAPSELQLRIGAWQTGIHVIQAFPFTGLGLGDYVYQFGAEPYRVPTQHRILDHPHDAYLQLAALGGIPLLIVFLILLAILVFLALHNWRLADSQSRPLLGAGIAVVTVLCIYSLSDAGWTVASLATSGWMMLGLIASPLLRTGEKSIDAHIGDVDIKRSSL